MSRLAFRARAIPLGQEGVLGTAGFPPTDSMAHGRMTRRHRLTVDANLLSQPARHPRLGVRELDPLGANPAVATDDAALPIDQRDRVGRPRQIIPDSLRHRPYAARPAATAAARVPSPPAPLDLNCQAASRMLPVALGMHDPEPG